MTWDWSIGPIFIAQLIALVLLFIPSKFRILGLRPKVLVLVLLLLACLGMVLSLYHHSTDPLHVYL